MSGQALHPSTDVAAADWLGPRLRRFGSAVTAVVPDGFPAYARIPHPARGPDGRKGRSGDLPAELLGILCATLTRHTGTPGSCWFCLWDGYGWLHGSPSVAMMGDRGPIATLVAGSDDLAEALVGDPRLEAWRVRPDDPIAFDSDEVDS
jgi:hypothetical protein